MNRRAVLWVAAIFATLLLGVSWLYQQAPVKLANSERPIAKNLDKTPVHSSIPPQLQQVKAFKIALDGTASVPARFQLPDVERVRTASSYQEWLARFSPNDQTKIKTFNTRHFGVYLINSPEQVAWMAQMGYPMPEDVIAAENLTDQDLRTLASGGNDKAGFLLHEREVDTLQAKYAELAAQGQTRDQFWRNDPSAMQYNKDDFQYNQLLLNSTSPFKGFVKAQDAILDEDPQYSPANVISGLLWAETYGDFRVDQFVRHYVGNDPMRLAMWAGALAVDGNDALTLSALREVGCPGFNVGNSIPGTVSPVQ